MAYPEKFQNLADEADNHSGRSWVATGCDLAESRTLGCSAALCAAQGAASRFESS